MRRSACRPFTALIVLRTDIGVAVIGGLSSGVIALLDFLQGRDQTSVLRTDENQSFSPTPL